MAAGGVGGDDDLILGILGIHHRAAEQIGILRVHVIIDFLAGFDHALLFKVHDGPEGGHGPLRQGRIGPAGSGAPLVQKQRVFRGGLQHRFRILLAVGRHGRKAVPPVLGHPGADAPAFTAGVLHQIAFQQHHPPGSVFMSPQHGLHAVGEVFRLGSDNICDHRSSL